MKLAITTLLPSLLLAASASAREASVYLINGGNSQHVDTSPPLTSASTARLVFAQRLDLAQYHSLKDADADAIQVLNVFGGRRRKLFGEDTGYNRPKAFLMIEGVENAQDVAPANQQASISSFRIRDPPTVSANAHLLADLNTQARADKPFEYSDMVYDEAVPLLKNLGRESTLGVRVVNGNGRVFVHVVGLDEISSQHGTSSTEYKNATTLIQSTIAALFEKSASKNWEVVMVAMPPAQSGGIFKRSSTTSWGSYSLPKRQEGSGRPDFLPNDFAGTETNVENPPANELDFDEFLAPNEPQETGDLTVPEYLDEPDSSSHTFSETLEEMIDELVDEIFEEFTPAASNPLSTLQETDTTPPLGILPTCYSTYDACVDTTHNCSGHGSCYKKFEDERSGGSKRACFVCGCKATYRRDDQDRIIKTTVWAGPACQKKDVSTQFWLLGGLTVLLVSIVAWGIGLLYSMGSQDLPSVIGAGVAGPRAAK